MATKVHMEALSPTMEEGQIVKWLKSEGDEVANGDVLAEVETDKATMELVARGDGILRKVLIGEGDTAPVGEVIGVIAGADEDISEFTGGASDSSDSSTGEQGNESSSDDKDESDAGDTDADDEGDAGEEGESDSSDTSSETRKAKSDRESEGSGGQSERQAADRIKASPLARRLAEDAGVDLAAVSGSGPGGRIVKKDVEGAAAQAEKDQKSAPASTGSGSDTGKARPAAPAPEPWDDSGASEGYEEVKVSQMRKTIARRLTESLSPVPHFFLTIEVDMGRVMAARKSVNAVIEKDGDKVSVNDFVLKATAAALAKHPWCNAAWHEDTIRKFEHVHIGVAVAVEDGLITPVVRHADRKGLVQISREVKEMAGRARQKKLKPEEYTGSTFSISNLGMFGISEFTAIINPPEAGILAIGAVEDTPVAMDGEVVVRPRMRVTMSCDHRVIDGATGSQFLGTLRSMLEEPAAILL